MICDVALPICSRRWVQNIRKWEVSATTGSTGKQGAQCVSRKYSIPLHDQWQPESLRQGRMGLFLHVVYAKFWPYSQTTDVENQSMLFQFLIVYRLLAYANCWLSFLFSAYRTGIQVWSFAPAAYLLQYLTCCPFKKRYFTYLRCNKWSFRYSLITSNPEGVLVSVCVHTFHTIILNMLI